MNNTEEIRICATCCLDKPLNQFRSRARGCEHLFSKYCLSCRQLGPQTEYLRHAKKRLALRRTEWLEEMRKLPAMDYSPANFGSNLRMVDQRITGAILGVIRQMR